MPERSKSVLSVVTDATLRRKLLVAFAAVAMITGLVGAVGLYGITQVSATTDTVVEDEVPMVDGAMMLKLAAAQERSAVKEAVLGQEGARADYDEARQWFDEINSKLLSRDDLSQEERRLLEQINATHQESVSLATAAMEASQRGGDSVETAKLQSYDETQQELISLGDEFEGVAKQRMQDSVAEANGTERQSRLGIIALTLVAVLLALGIGWRVGGTVGREVRRVRDVAERIAAGRLDVEVEESDRGDEIGDLVDSFAAMQSYLRTVSDQARAVADQEFDADVLDEDVPGALGDAMDQLATDIETAQREAEEARENVEELVDALEAKAADYSETMERAADGDLTQRMDPDSESEAMTQIGEAFNDMMDDIEDTLAHIRGFADEVAQSSQSLTASTGEIEGASEQVSESVQQIADSAEEQNESLTQVNGEMQSLSGSVEEIASSADQVAATAEQANDRGQVGREAATAAIDEMDEIQATADETIEEVETLADEMEEISEIVDLITEIAEQTNMLALNASIEAARAGEAGEGFAVVADEIKGLAAEVGDATDEIESLIADVEDSTSETVEDMQTLGRRVETGTDTIEEALDALDEIVESVEETNRGIQEISDATDDQAASTEEIVSMVDEVSTAADQANAEAENASAAAEEQTASLGEVAEQVDSLSGQAEDLQSMLDEFTIDASDGGATAGTTGSPDRAVVSDGGREDGSLGD